MAEFDRQQRRGHAGEDNWSPRQALNVLSTNAQDIAVEEAKLQKEAAQSRESFEGPLAKAIEKGDVLERETHYSDADGIKKAGKLILQYDVHGNPASAQFRDNLGNVEDITLDKTHTGIAQDKVQTDQGVTATFDFNGTQLVHESIVTPKSMEQYEFDGSHLSRHVFSMNGQVLELRDDQVARTITAAGPAVSGGNPIVREKYDYGVIDTTPRTIEFTAKGKQYRGIQLSDGRWKLGEVQ